MREYIHDTVGQFIELHGDGERLSARCPFHQEQTPSFVVDQKKNTYHCFGCGEHGHVEDFKMALDQHRSAKSA